MYFPRNRVRVLMFRFVTSMQAYWFWFLDRAATVQPDRRNRGKTASSELLTWPTSVALPLVFSRISPPRHPHNPHNKHGNGQENTKFQYEIRNKYEIRNSKPEAPFSNFEIEISNMFRISDFGFRICSFLW